MVEVEVMVVAPGWRSRSPCSHDRKRMRLRDSSRGNCRAPNNAVGSAAWHSHHHASHENRYKARCGSRFRGPSMMMRLR